MGRKSLLSLQVPQREVEGDFSGGEMGDWIGRPVESLGPLLALELGALLGGAVLVEQLQHALLMVQHLHHGVSCLRHLVHHQLAALHVTLATTHIRMIRAKHAGIGLTALLLLSSVCCTQ